MTIQVQNKLINFAKVNQLEIYDDYLCGFFFCHQLPSMVLEYIASNKTYLNLWNGKNPSNYITAKIVKDEVYTTMLVS